MAARRQKTKTTGKRKASESGYLPAIARGLALFLGVFSLLNVLGDLLSPGLDANHWWIDLRPIHSPAADLFLMAAAFSLIAYSIRPTLSPGRRILTCAFLAALVLITVWNAVTFYLLIIRRDIRSDFPVAFSVFICGPLATILISLGEQNKTRRKKAKEHSMMILVVTVLICMVGFPFAQMFCFGRTDYRRPADAIVVFGARVYTDGRVSDALADRVRTGCELYLDGFADRIVFSGGPGDGDVHETEGMRAMALKLGIPAQAIILDVEGLSTRNSEQHLRYVRRAWNAKSACRQSFLSPAANQDVLPAAGTGSLCDPGQRKLHTDGDAVFHYARNRCIVGILSEAAGEFGLARLSLIGTLIL